MKNLYILIGIWFSVLSFSSCKKAAYLTDDGLHVAEVDQTTYDYLASHPNGMFDTLLLVIDHFNLKEEINNAKTFWAPSDYSVNRYYQLKKDSVTNIDENAQYPFSQFLEEIPVDSVRVYICNDAQYSLDNGPITSYGAVTNAAGIDGFVYHKQKQAQLAWSYQPAYYLYYVKVHGEPDQVGADGVITTKEDDKVDTRVLCQTTGIKTSSGTLLHVLANTHTFIDGFVLKKDIAEVVQSGNQITFTYELEMDFDAVDYSGLNAATMLSRLASFYGVSSGYIPGLIGNSITYYAVEPDGTLNPNSTANAPGHWFDATGKTCSWGTDAVIVSELTASTMTFGILQYPNKAEIGKTYTVKQALVYKQTGKSDLQANFVFNITIK
ncbi:DUF4859 domain-containing protein [Sphingobacterium sp. LRF_L2]|uniref:DUF4859 domain-containing protein n=1 Tax=Sphingobacterium sp. LRF_L2 TaxID=3369421 RepID=UPI003F5D76D9